MDSFLQQVARHYFEGGGLDTTMFIFPNRRSLSFFRKYLGETVRKAMFVPRMYTINDFFCRVAGVGVSDRILLLLRLYRVYHQLNPKAESLDEFIFWGDVILGDFDDIDKYLVDARLLLGNVSDLKAMDDDYSYLTERQKEAIDNFIRHFRDTSGRVTAKLEGKDFKRRFLDIWNILYPLYTRFREDLSASGLAYEGMVYRAFADSLKEKSVRDVLSQVFPDTEKYVFVGLNALNECEKTVLAKMRDASIAEFEWDYVSTMISDPANKSSLFMSDNLRRFPQAFTLSDDPRKLPEIKVISAPSSVGGVKLLPGILSSAGEGDPVRTAVVLPDEKLLLPVLNTIPEQYEDVNVTMGYPMSSSSLYSLTGALAQLFLRSREKDGVRYFYHRPVRSVFSNSVFRAILSEEEKAATERIKAGGKYYIPAGDLSAGEVMKCVFRADIATVEDIEKWMLDVFVLAGSRLAVSGELTLEVDFAKRYHSAVQLLSDIRRRDDSLSTILPVTWFRLLDSLARGESVPFEGEPLRGLQIMGPLETRALDFDNVIILSANEGVFPRRSVSSSFIPPQLRKGFGLPTYEFQDAVWAYYFYRLIQRAGKLWLIYDSRTEGVRTGEESRYIKQLRYHFAVPMEQFSVSSRISRSEVAGEIPKTAEDIALIRSKELSASSLKSYLDCPAKFYYKFVKGLKTEDEVGDSLDSRQIGNVYHKMMQYLYTGDDPQHPLRRISSGYIKERLASPGALKQKIDALIREEMHSFEVAGRNILLSDVIQQYVVKTLERDLELIASYGTDGFDVLGLEREFSQEDGGFHFKGFIDRMDSFSPDEVRVVDYKTGKVTKDDVEITDENAAEIAGQLFDPESSSRPSIAFQLYLYDVFVRGNGEYGGRRVINSVYAPAKLFVEKVKNVPVSERFCEIVREKLGLMLEEMVNPEIPFLRTDSPKTCGYCDFKTICGR